MPITEEQNVVASQEQETVSQEPTQEASEQVPDPKIQEEFDRRVQSEADKRVKVFDQKIRDLESQHRAEIKKIQQELESERTTTATRRDIGDVDTLLSRYVENGDLPESSVPSIRDYAKNLLERDKQTRERETKAAEKERKAAEVLQKAEDTAREVADLKATKAIRKLASSVGVSLSEDEAEAIAKKTQGNTDWAGDLILARVSPKVETPEKPKPHKPDSSAATAPGGKLTDTQLREKYGHGEISDETYEKEIKARGIPA